MHLRILGSLEVRTSTARVDINAPKQKAVLATLLLDLNNEVSLERLTQCVWDGQSPSAVAATLRSYIYRLRRSLQRVPGVELETHSSSYVLRVDPVLVDLWYFRQQVTQAHEQTLQGDLAEAVQHLRSALSVWRGEALAGVPGRFLKREAQFLEEERIAAHEELFNAEITLGKHRKIVPELQKISSLHQYHEALQAQLMLALYRGGRQVEALQVYAVTRRRLREGLGIEPGPDLQNLHRAILEQVPATQIMFPLTSA
jgi:DNA-binding SARP family transcriptional activator